MNPYPRCESLDSRSPVEIRHDRRGAQMNNARTFRIAQIATGDVDEAMDLVHVVRLAASPRPATVSGPLIESRSSRTA